MLQIIFGDDEHTAADGSYARVMKTRKWLYFSSAATLAVSAGLYNENAASDLLKIVRLPVNVLEPLFAAGVAYLLLQYLFLILQLLSTYDIVLSDRFTFRRSDELASARDRVSEARNKYYLSLNNFNMDRQKALQSRLRELALAVDAGNLELHSAINELALAERQMRPIADLGRLQHNVSRRKAIRAVAATNLKNLEANGEAELTHEHDPDVKLSEEALDDAETAFYKLQRQVPSERTGYQAAERIIDLTRVVPPAALAIIAICHYLDIDLPVF